MNKGWMLCLLVCVSVSLQIEGGGWQRLKLWKYRRDTKSLEKKLKGSSWLDEAALTKCHEKATRLCSKVPDRQDILLRKCETCQERFMQLIREKAPDVCLAEGKSEEVSGEVSDVQETIEEFEHIAENPLLLERVRIVELDMFQKEAIAIVRWLKSDPDQSDLCRRATRCADAFMQKRIDKTKSLQSLMEASTEEDTE